MTYLSHLLLVEVVSQNGQFDVNISIAFQDNLPHHFEVSIEMKPLMERDFDKEKTDNNGDGDDDGDGDGDGDGDVKVVRMRDRPNGPGNIEEV